MTYLPPLDDRRRPGGRQGARRAKPLAALAVGAALVTGLVVTGVVLLPAAPSEAATRSAVAGCVTSTDESQPLGDRFAGCRQRVLAWFSMHRFDWNRTPLPAWAPDVHRSAESRSHDLTPVETTTPSSAGTTGTPAATSSTSETSTPTVSTDPSATTSPTDTAAPDVTDSISASPSTATDPIAVAAGFTATFGTRAESGVIDCKGQSGVTISGKTFRGIGNDTPAITISNCTDVTITQNDFIDDAEPIYVVNSTNVKIEYNRYQNITGPHARNGSHRGNFTQWENSTGGSISHNVGVGGDTEDIISIYKSGGASATDPLLIEDNWFQGTNWTSTSGSGIMLGDGGGSHVSVRNNVLVNPGQVGIGVSGGSDLHVVGNTILGQPRTSSNVGIYVWGQGTSCSAIEVADNSVDFEKASGASSGGWDGGTCGSIAGWSSNDFTASLVLSLLQVAL